MMKGMYESLTVPPLRISTDFFRSDLSSTSRPISYSSQYPKWGIVRASVLCVDQQNKIRISYSGGSNTKHVRILNGKTRWPPFCLDFKWSGPFKIRTMVSLDHFIQKEKNIYFDRHLWECSVTTFYDIGKNGTINYMPQAGFDPPE